MIHIAYFTRSGNARVCTREGSGLGRSLQDILRLCPGTTMLEGLAVRGSQVRSADEAVQRWLEVIGIAAVQEAR